MVWHQRRQAVQWNLGNEDRVEFCGEVCEYVLDVDPSCLLLSLEITNKVDLIRAKGGEIEKVEATKQSQLPSLPYYRYTFKLSIDRYNVHNSKSLSTASQQQRTPHHGLHL
jgi:hypothetical protein